jgi:hypothetical protein
VAMDADIARGALRRSLTRHGLRHKWTGVAGMGWRRAAWSSGAGAARSQH